jgi:hypothetical protein
VRKISGIPHFHGGLINKIIFESECMGKGNSLGKVHNTCGAIHLFLNFSLLFFFFFSLITLRIKMIAELLLII